MNANLDFTSDKPITTSELYQLSLTSEKLLLDNLCDMYTHLCIPSNQEIIPELPREEKDGDATRILISYFTDKENPTTITGMDTDRFSNTVNIDKVTKFILEGMELDAPNLFDLSVITENLPKIFACGMFDFVDRIEGDRETYENTTVVDEVMVDALSAWIAIAFNDPLDIWIQVTGLRSDEKEAARYCYIKAVKPRLKN